ncbi:MAG: hypothetical protein K1X94_17250 [Sandaracinaceae bacterium]|nr:hypothetical protein [Sandaracinaceae bacterium]
MIQASVTQRGRSFSFRIDRSESFDLVARDAAGTLLWKRRLSTPYHHVTQASIRVLEGGDVELRAAAFHVKDDSEHVFVWRYSAEGDAR